MFLKKKQESAKHKEMCSLFQNALPMQTSRVPRKQNLDAFLSFFIFLRENRPNLFVHLDRPLFMTQMRSTNNSNNIGISNMLKPLNKERTEHAEQIRLCFSAWIWLNINLSKVTDTTAQWTVSQAVFKERHSHKHNTPQSRRGSALPKKTEHYFWR